MPSITSFTVTYDALNDCGTLSEGDKLTGKVTLSVSKEITVESLFVKVKGDANVHWTKRMNDRTYSYTAHRRYFKLKQFLIPEGVKDTVIPPGTHVYGFSMNIPRENMPSSFRGSHGKIVYMLEAKLSRSWRMDRTVEKELNFVSKSIANPQTLMSCQTGSTNKEMGVFSKGNAHMNVIVDRRAYAPGDSVVIDAKINNSSSSEMTPKFSLIRDVVFRAQGNTKHEESVVNKVADKCIKPQTEKTVKCVMKIPRDLVLTIQNCEIISVEYHLKVYLDISFAFDPKILFPVLIIPPDLVSGHGVAMGPYPAGAIGGPGTSDFPPPSVAMGPYPAGAIGGPSTSDFPPPSVAMGPYPARAIGGHNSFTPPVVAVGPNSYQHPGAQSYSAPPPQYPGPQQASPYGDPFTSSSSVLHPPPTAPIFPPPLSAPFSLPSSTSAATSTYLTLPSAPEMTTDFLSQSDEPPPAYSLLFPSSAPETSGAK
uniref:arrestin domain-containing protein 3-like isoform X2 n=1 Tax=Scatophagus argus TaxID=75038 RepID=UPI001ED7F9B4|nr:arrestin domain-containing protein 3-like isoform X2 [Scatophagus argus]XP_046242994.1 arrestin domain-containing protein 3-like isoform X3 [Scatophagus argus]